MGVLMKQLVFLSFVCVVVNVFADEPSLEEQIQRVSEQNVYGQWQGASQSASVNSGFVFEADFLYWKALVDGLVFSQKIDVTVPAAFPGTINVVDDVNDLDFKWDPGFKLGAGYIFEGRQQWAAKLFWTYYHSKASGSEKSDPAFITGTGLKPMWLPFLMGSIADRARANWSLNYNVFDAMTGRDMFLGRYVSMNPQIGIRGAWINQDYRVKYHGAFTYNDAGVENFLTTDTKFSGSNDFSGAGLRFGSDLTFFLTKNLLIQGNGFFSLLYGEFEVKELYDGAFIIDLGAGPTLVPEVIRLTKNFNAVKPCLETELGGVWQIFAKNDQYRFSIGAFYQFVYWFAQNNLVNQILMINDSPINATAINTNRDVTNLNPKGDLQMQGIKIQLNFDF